jgi:hypothetical protein
MNDQLIREVTRVAIYTLAFIAVSMVGVMLYGLFDPKIDNNRVFEVLVPAFQMVLGAFIGFLGGIQVGKSHDE